MDQNNEQDGLFPGAFSPSVTQQGQAGVDDQNSDIFFAAVEKTRMPIILTDPKQADNPIVFANHAFLRMTGYELSDIVGHNCRFLQGPETSQETVDEVREAIAKEADTSVEILNYRKDGTTFWNALFVSPVYSGTGELVYFFASQLDVSRRRDAEIALRQSQKMEAVGQLTGGIAHDFNNLLQIINGYSETLKIRARASGDDKMVRQVAAVAEAAARATTLTQQLLAFSRKQKLEGRIVNLNQLVVDMTQLARRAIGGESTLETALEQGLWNVRVDPSQAETALLNIFINARDAMPSGGTIKVHTANLVVDENHSEVVNGLPPGSYASIAITDAGTGIDPAVLKRVMDPFFTTKEEGKGTGLGLSMVYGFVKQSGGTVQIDSKLGQGTTVRLYFPASDQSVAAAPKRAERSMDRGGSERILVVDDRQDVAELAQVMLEDAGYAVKLAYDAKSALALIEVGERFDLLFTDLIMPGGMNGIRLAREVRKRHPKMKVLLTTGYAEISMERTDDDGVEFDTLSKPYKHGELIRKVRIILDGPTGVS